VTDDLVKRLRVGVVFNVELERQIMNEAADRIETLEAALEKIAKHDVQAMAIDALRPGTRTNMENALREIADAVGDPSAYWIARAALGEKDDE
jgi:2-C-methyl-D-erythritol 4-phosphate cytidylyltransferase